MSEEEELRYAIEEACRYTIVALSYRGFWTSKGRPSERGINLDAAAALDWVSANFSSDATLVLWGQSLGAGVAAAATAAYQASASEKKLEIKGLLLETPFTSIRDMLTAIYPQKWLPYKHLWPFLRGHWDSRVALREIAELDTHPKVLILQAGGDELVPKEHGVELEAIARRSGMDVRRAVVSGALHHEVLAKPHGRAAVVEFLKKVGQEG